MKVISRNAIQCKHCGDIIESKSVHDFKYCSCMSCFVDGGLNYLRRGCKTSPEEDYIDLSEYKDVDGYHVAYRSKYLDFTSPYECDLAEPLEKIYKRFPKHLYDLRIIKEDGTVVVDTLSGESE